jgi:hypothetical protein
MNRVIISIAISAFAACAAAQTPAPSAAEPAQSKPNEAMHVVADNSKIVDRKCLRETGSHIVRKDRRDCMNLNGNSYSREDIDHTGAVDVADALRLLDPSISVGR